MWLRCGNKIHSLDPYRKFSKSPWFLSSYPFSDTPHKKPKQAPLQERRMIDRFRLCAKGGDGGNGCSSLRRGRTDRRGKPDGGNGGRGGDVILECSSTIWDLSSLLHHINAKRGGHGTSKNKIGSRGDDKIVRVPVGTVIHLLDGDIPSTVETKSSSAALDPWDMPGTMDFSLDENDQKSISYHPTLEERVETESKGNIFSIDGKTLHRSASEKEATDATLLKSFCYSSRCYRKPTGEEIDYDHLQATDSDTYESEGEEENNENEKIQYNIAELTEPGQRIVIAQGGDGGLGNVSTIKNSKKSTLEHEHDVSDDDVFGDEASSQSIGLPGSEVVLVLELKSIADVGLVGMPNAGKSTLLGAMSKAKPTVGHYAFTTLRPNLGNLSYDDFSVTVADIPGLIKGAHENRGLGHAFLRHIERTKVLAYVLDLSAGLDGRKGLPPWEQLRDLVSELEFYREGLSSRPCLIVANKIDEEGAEEVYKELKRRVPSVPILPVCAVLEEGVSEVRECLKKLVHGGEVYRLNLEGIVIDE